MMVKTFDPAEEFYAWSEELIGVSPGTVLRQEPAGESRMIPGASTGFRFLYASTGHAQAPTAVSGLLYLPAGPAPTGGWPVISYAHGTTGIIPSAAPSLAPMAMVLGHSLLGVASRFLEHGYAVVCSDYEGLGTAGPHPYLHGPSLACSQIDAARAARQLSEECSASWAAVGQSEGGLATLFAAASATTYAPELDFRGAVATAPPTEWETLGASTTDFGRILTPLILHAARYHDPSVSEDAWLNEDGMVLAEAWRSSFLQEPGTVLATFLELLGKPLLRLAPGESTDAEAASRLAATIDFSGLEVPRVRHDRPVFLGEGGADEFCVPGTIERLGQELAAQGSDVEHHLYPETSHLDVPYAALEDIVAFLGRVLEPAS